MTEEDFNNLIDQHLETWQRTVIRITNNADDANEAVQQALIAAWEKRHSFGFRARAASWVCRIAINRAYNIIRKRRRDAERENAYAQEDCVHEPQENVLDKLQRALELLPEPYRETVAVAIANNLSAEKCIRILNCRPGTFYWRMQQAKIRLKKIMEDL